MIDKSRPGAPARGRRREAVVAAVSLSEKVAICMTAPEVAVTVTVDVTDAPPVAADVPGEWAPLQADRAVMATTPMGRSSRHASPRRLVPRKRSKATARDEPENNTSAAAAADIAEVFIVTVETTSPDALTVAAEKVQVAPVGNPEQAYFTAGVAVKPFSGDIVTVAVPAEPVATVTDAGVTARLKSGAGAVLAGVISCR